FRRPLDCFLLRAPRPPAAVRRGAGGSTRRLLRLSRARRAVRRAVADDPAGRALDALDLVQRRSRTGLRARHPQLRRRLEDLRPRRSARVRPVPGRRSRQRRSRTIAGPHASLPRAGRRLRPLARARPGQRAAAAPGRRRTGGDAPRPQRVAGERTGHGARRAGGILHGARAERGARSMAEHLNVPTRKALMDASSLCQLRTHYNVEIEHWLLRLLETRDTDFEPIVRRFELDPGRLRADLERELDATSVRTGHVLLALLSEKGFAAQAREMSEEFEKISADGLRREFTALLT